MNDVQNISINGGITAGTVAVGNQATVNVTYAPRTYPAASNDENISYLISMLIKKSENTEFYSKVIDACETIHKERVTTREPSPSVIGIALKKLSEIAPAITGAASIVDSIQKLIK